MNRATPPGTSQRKTVYVFLVKRRTDSFVWPCVMNKERQAEEFPGRVSAVHVVTMEYGETAPTGDADKGIPTS
jgi:hypothetical protein